MCWGTRSDFSLASAVGWLYARTGIPRDRGERLQIAAGAGPRCWYARRGLLALATLRCTAPPQVFATTPPGVSLSIACGSTCDSLAARSSGDMPTLAASCFTVSEPKA